MFHKKNLSTTLIGLGLLIAFSAGLFVYQHANKASTMDTTQFNGTLLETPRAIQNFALLGMNDKPFDNDNLKKQWTLMFFGFTSCPSICPTTMADLAKMYGALEKKGVEPLPEVVFISVDPARDSIEKLKTYITAFNPNFYAATGQLAILEQMTKEFGVAYEVVPARDNPANYDIQHSGTVLLFNPKGELNAFFTMPHDGALMAKDYSALVSFWKKHHEK